MFFNKNKTTVSVAVTTKQATVPVQVTSQSEHRYHLELLAQAITSNEQIVKIVSKDKNWELLHKPFITYNATHH